MASSPSASAPSTARHGSSSWGAGSSLGLAAWVGLGVLAGAALVFDASLPYPGLIAVVPTGAAVLLIAGGAQAVGPGVLLRTMPLRFIGRISYSLYLWHWPVLVLGGLAIGGTLGLDQSIGLVGVAFLLAVATWALVEEPFRRGRVPMPARPRLTVAAGVAAMLVVALIGTAFDSSDEAALASLSGPADVAAAEPMPSSDTGPAPTDLPATDTGSSTIAEPSGLPTMPGHPLTPTPAPTPGATQIPPLRRPLRRRRID